MLSHAALPGLTISIHAPLTGCDADPRKKSACPCHFNPRTPHGVRLSTKRWIIIYPRYFNPRTPHGVRRRSRGLRRARPTISIHAPLTGCDPPQRGCRGNQPHFNPRTPHGVRHTDMVDIQTRLSISIHAPLTGCDNAASTILPCAANFNPRTPHGVRHPAHNVPALVPGFQSTHPSRGATSCAVAAAQKIQFQSTHPSRGATIKVEQGKVVVIISIHAPLTGCDLAAFPAQYFFRISLHAPLTGCDSHSRAAGGDTGRFQSTHPSRGATVQMSRNAQPEQFQSTHPSRGATTRNGERRPNSRISIHAPLTGCDRSGPRVTDNTDHFNPRTPHGVRLALLFSAFGFGTFQSTHPSRGATRRFLPSLSVHSRFQSTHPSRGSTVMLYKNIQRFIISIHAPLTGCDEGPRSAASWPTNFNPRTPHGVRRGISTSRENENKHFNPRTPHGVRRYKDIKTPTNAEFQSTHPSRGATRPISGCQHRGHHFNPRTPHGVRRHQGPQPNHRLLFQSTHPSRGATAKHTAH